MTSFGERPGDERAEGRPRARPTLVGRLQAHVHVAGVTPIWDRVGIRVVRAWKAGPVRVIHGGKYIVGHDRNDRHLAYHQLDVIASELDSPRIIEADLARLLDDPV